MPRHARVVVPQVALHIVQRGHNKQDCFRAEMDYLVYLANLRDLLPKAGCALHAYCLMTNHVHLFVTPARADSSAWLMRNLGQRYVQYFNRRYGRRGTLWEGRFHSCLVDSARYVLACYRYVERNPVEAGMVPSPGSYRWSSYDGNAGRAENPLLSPHPEYIALGTAEAARHAAYREMLRQEDEPDFLAAIRGAPNGSLALVGDGLRPPSVPK